MSNALLGVIAIGLGVAGLVPIWREFSLLSRIRRSGISATGTVVKHVKGRRGVDRPVIRFADQRGHHVEFTPNLALLNKFVPEGEQFPVRYLAGEPQRARLASGKAQFRSLLVFTLVCLGLLVAGLLLMLGVLPPAKHGTKPRSGPEAWIVLLTVPSVVGLCILGFGSYWIGSTLVMRRKGITTTGKVVRTWSAGGDGSRSRKALIEFMDTNQRRLQFITGNLSKSAVGSTVQVAYWPDRPDQARLASVSRATFSVTVGTLFCALMVGLLLFA